VQNNQSILVKEKPHECGFSFGEGVCLLTVWDEVETFLK
jgi:hypothetical protein